MEGAERYTSGILPASHTKRGAGPNQGNQPRREPPRREPRKWTKKPTRQENARGKNHTRDRYKQGQNATKATSKHLKISRNQGRRGEQTAHPREKQAKRDSGARTTALKQSQQPGNPRPGRWPKMGNATHRKLRETAETLIHPRLKTEWGNSPCPIAAEKTTREKNQANKREGTGRMNSDRNTFRERSHRPRGKVPPTEVLKAKQTRPSQKVSDRAQTPQQLCNEPPKIQRAAGRGGSDPVDSWNSRGKQGLPKEMWLAP